MPGFEIGVVYKKGSKYFIAVDAKTLVTCGKGRAAEVRPSTRYDMVRKISVDDLCGHWGITLDQFDVLMCSYIAPSQETAKPRPRGSRRPREADEELWRRHRTGRIAKSRL